MSHSRLFYLFIALAAFGIVGSAFYQESVSQKRLAELKAELKAENERQTRVETADVGYDEVVSARDGDLITITGNIDIKFRCQDVSESQSEICTLKFFGPKPGKSMLARMKVCSDEQQKNCIVWSPNSQEGFNPMMAYIIDDKGQKVAIDGKPIVEKPNPQVIYPQYLMLTAKVTEINGKGRFLDPIERIESTK